MATYIMLGSFTDQGIRNVKDTTKRAENIKAAAKKLGITVKEIYWTLGQYDTALIADAPDEATMTAFGLTAGSQGNVRTQTLRAFSPEEMGRILSHIG
jgi:uncharacterized protein with GYD domain